MGIVIGLPFSDSITRQCVNITILQDGIVESVETLSVNLLSFSPIVTLDVSTAIITIFDSDSKIVFEVHSLSPVQTLR